MEYSYIYGLLPLLEFTLWNYVYLIIFLITVIFVLTLKIFSMGEKKLYCYAIMLLISLCFFGLLGFSLHCILTLVFYAMISEFGND